MLHEWVEPSVVAVVQATRADQRYLSGTFWTVLGSHGFTSNQLTN